MTATPNEPTPEPTELERAWQAHIDQSTELLDRLVVRHRERQRRYHRIDHVEAVLRHVDELAATEPVDDLGVVVAAAFYHDAVYEPTHPANESASARLARRDLARLGWPADRVERVATMIEATRDHAAAPDVDTAVLFDADLAILGAEPPSYRDYATRVRAEYAHVDDHGWRSGRAGVLQGLLDQDSIFHTATGRRRWDEAARRNIGDELAALRG